MYIVYRRCHQSDILTNFLSKVFQILTIFKKQEQAIVSSETNNTDKLFLNIFGVIM